MPKKPNVDFAKAKKATDHGDDWRQICRTCLGSKKRLLSIFNSYLNFTFSHYITTLADVKISEDDQLPNVICKSCVKELKNVIRFQEKCQNSDKYLHNCLIIDPNEEIALTAVKNESVTKQDMSVKKESEDSSSQVKQEHFFIEVQCPTIKEENIKEEPEDDEMDFDADEPLVRVASKKKSVKKAKYGPLGLDCNECNRSFESEAKRRAHWYNAHRANATKQYKCKTCQRIFKSDFAFENHNKGDGCKDRFKGIRIGIENNKKMYFCTSCDYKKSTRADVWKHYLTHTGEHPYACNMCSKAYTSHKSLSYHKETVHQVYKLKITCHLCGKVVEGQNRFNRHLHRTHPNSQYQCDLCKAFLKSKWGMILHLKIHENLKEYVCETCGKPFNTSLNLRNHIRNVHEGRQTLDCELCPYKIKDPKSFKRHILQHSQDKIQCAVCFKFLDSPVKLIKHMEYHGEKKHFCLFCNKGFVRRKDCTSHERIMHIKKMPLHYIKKHEPSPASEEMNVCE